MAEIIKLVTMHEDHRNWQSEHSMWRQDVESWEKQLKTGLSEVEELQQLLNHQQDVITNHINTIEMQEKILGKHEHDLASCEKLGMEYQDTLTKRHFEMNKELEKAREDHERIKNYHHKLIARLMELQKTMDAPM